MITIEMSKTKFVRMIEHYFFKILAFPFRHFLVTIFMYIHRLSYILHQNFICYLFI